MIIRTCGLLFALATLLGCTTTLTRVVSNAHLPTDQPIVAVESHQKLVLPAEFGVLGPPGFPPHAFHARPRSVLVCLAFTVDDGGAVVDIDPESFASEDCVDATETGSAPFVDAAIAAVERWSFLAAAVCTFRSVEAAQKSDEDCTGALAVESIPVRLAWTFLFTVDREGRSTVSVRR